MDSNTIRVLYENVLQDDVKANRIQESEIRKAINNMKEVYKPDPTSLQSDVVEVAHYDDAAHRCAYLHKYAPLHTALVSDMLQLAMQRNAHVFQAIINKHGSFNVCSLGGGPGNDVIAVLDVLHSVLGYFQAEATIVDIMVGWKYTFESILEELRCEDYGPISEHMSEQYFTWSYEKANLLSKMTAGSNRAIASANLITMIKFVSASSCKDTATMIGKIFRSMKQGAMVLYIDNAGGGFHQLMTQEAAACNLISIFGPLKHYLFSNAAFNVKRFGYTPCLETTVTVHLWKKPLPAQCSNSSNLVNHTDTGAVSKQSNNPQRQSRSHSRTRHRSRSRGQSNVRNSNLKRSQSQPGVSVGLSLPNRKPLADLREGQGFVGTNGTPWSNANDTRKSLVDFKRAEALNGYCQATNSALQSWLVDLQSKAPGRSNVNNSRVFQVDNKQAEALNAIQKATDRAVQSWLTDCRGNSLVTNNPSNTSHSLYKKAAQKKSATNVDNRPHVQPVVQKKPSIATNDSRKTQLDNRQPGTASLSSQAANVNKNLTKSQSNTKRPAAVSNKSSVANNPNALRKAQLDSKMPVAQSGYTSPVDSYSRGTYSTVPTTNYPIYIQPTSQRNYVNTPISTANTAPAVSYQQQPAAPRSVVANENSWDENNCCGCCVIS